MFFSLIGCLPDLNGPAVLATGIGHPQALSLTAQNKLLVGADDGLYFVDYYGVVSSEEALKGKSIQSVAAHIDRLYVLDDQGRIGWRATDSDRWDWKTLSAAPQQIMAWSNHHVILVFEKELTLWSPEKPELEAWKTGFSSIIDIAYDTQDGCGGLILATVSGVFRNCEDRTQQISALVLDQISTSRAQVWGLQDGQIGLLAADALLEKRSFPAKDMIFGANSSFPDHLLYGVMAETLELTQCLPEKLAD